jgi:hypothetical protein
LLLNEDQYFVQRGEDIYIKDLMPNNDKSAEEKEKINKELLDSFLKKEKDLLMSKKQSYSAKSKKISDTINCLNKLSAQAKTVLSLNKTKPKPNKFIIDL